MSQRARVLVVSADRELRRHLERMVRASDLEPFLVEGVDEALQSLADLGADVVLVGSAPERVGADVALLRDQGVPLVVAVETPDVTSTVDWMRHGASDVVPARDRRAFRTALERAVQESSSRGGLEGASREVRDRYGFNQLVSQSPRMLEVFDRIQAVAKTDATVLVLGETGTGKERISQAIHARSNRRDKPMIAVNCGAFAESLLESELFGHERGSFTGATGRREGLFEMADGGTLFLDELGETSLNVQVSLLRVLEDFRFRRVGGRDLVDVDVRIVAATNVELETAVNEGRFRQDLFYRLNVFPIHLPPLRERPEDIPLLMRMFLDEMAESYTLDPPIVSAEAMDAILRYHWPGNIRQLRAMCERWVITRPGQRLEAADLDRAMVQQRPSPRPGTLTIQDDASLKANTNRVVEQLERAYLYRQLRRQGGHLARTAEAAGITRRTLYTKMKQYGLEASDFRLGEEP
ncbi:MAG: sigma-54-dependent Fis family transcriptional regulator [Alphaproteobacteria bacterium]|nr:sigma-54-dependent Fis family transcriptional regulator [Alphaproteobacteria bacterium]